MPRTRRIRTSTAALLLTGTLLFPLVPAAATPSLPPDGGASAAQWQGDARAYSNIAATEDVDITMSDGTLLRATVYRPTDAHGNPIAEPLPVVLNLTPYTRLVNTLVDAITEHPQLRPLLDSVIADANVWGEPFDGIHELAQAIPGGGARVLGVNRDLVRSGYVQVIVDVRGTGYSHGTWDVLQAREQKDSVEILQWASEQPWSNGATAMAGISYSAINSLQAASHRPPSLKAVFAVEPAEDLAHDIVMTGGAGGVGFMPLWIGLVNGLKFLPSLEALLAGNFDPAWLADRLADPLVMGEELLEAALFADGIAAHDGPFYAGINPNIENIAVPTFVVGAYHDIFARGQVRIYDRLQLPASQKKLLMGQNFHINPGYRTGGAGQPPTLDVLERTWFDRWVRGVPNGIESYGPIVSDQMGGDWTVTSAIPRAGSEPRKLHLHSTASGTASHALHDGSLRPEPSGPARLSVGPGVQNVCSRDAAVGTAGIVAILGAQCTRDNRFAETEALTFTSEPYAHRLEVSGPMNLRLVTTTDLPEGMWHVTVQDVSPDGLSTTVNSGGLLSSRRAIDASRSTTTATGDYLDAVHPLTRDSVLSVVPGERTVLDIDLRHTDFVLKPGHRLRVTVAAGNPVRYLPLIPSLAATGLQPQHVELDPGQPSWLMFTAK
ncbi:CocE/NonD family hydrolase [Hoyosella rhizosphaerae]|uniref:Peptidase n=1 Tax=Hoyosella rhizosphaerae TaxID=1755582 RepID=A0A916U777_9ACTN|nr:CocE/NonD family hydrolase [Hoyosella rhizosphaerae]MBN4927728.1 CocE/NonD family hydrolase [Hoyosella rhizosphaerae]GGC62045.1 putative peptidase [Hoyosella rhizosphaerae]